MAEKRKIYNIGTNIIDKMIKINQLENSEVTNPNMFKKGFVPTDDGIMSETIFGITEYDKRSMWGWIDLNGNYLHPLTYRAIASVNRKMVSLINGTATFKFDKQSGTFVEDENGETGIEFLYKHYNQINWRNSASVMQQKKVEYLKRDRSEVFVNKWLVMPKFYRDVDRSGSNTSHHEINKLYNTILRLTKNEGDPLFAEIFQHNTKARVQKTLNDITSMFIDGDMQLAKKKGILRRYVNGKQIDYAARLVITAPDISGERPNDLPIPFGYAGLPISAAISCGFPLIINALKNFFESEFVTGGKYPFMSKGEKMYLTFENPMETFNNDYLTKMLKRFINSPESRFDKIKLPPNKEGKKGYLRLSCRFDKDGTTINRAATWTDILYIISKKVLEQSIIYVTRAPIEHFLCIFPAKPKILSTLRTVKATVNSVHYDDYPFIPDDLIIRGGEFVDSLVPNNTYLEAIGGDFDGDQVTVKMVYSEEAILEGEKFIKDKKNLLKLTGENFRTSARDFKQTAFSFSQPPRQGKKVLDLVDLN